MAVFVGGPAVLACDFMLPWGPATPSGEVDREEPGAAVGHVPNKEVTRAVGWGRGSGGQTPNHGSATPSGRLSTRKLPCSEAQDQEALLCRRVHCSGVQMETRRGERQLPRAHAELLDPEQPFVEVAREWPCSLNPPWPQPPAAAPTPTHTRQFWFQLVSHCLSPSNPHFSFLLAVFQ